MVDHPTVDLMFPHHQFEILNRHTSSGNTQVLINGRELSQLEWIIWSQLLGYPIAPESYWLDHLGNASYEGFPIPIINTLAFYSLLFDVHLLI